MDMDAILAFLIHSQPFSAQVFPFFSCFHLIQLWMTWSIFQDWSQIVVWPATDKEKEKAAKILTKAASMALKPIS